MTVLVRRRKLDPSPYDGLKPHIARKIAALAFKNGGLTGDEIKGLAKFHRVKTKPICGLLTRCGLPLLEHREEDPKVPVPVKEALPYLDLTLKMESQDDAPTPLEIKVGLLETENADLRSQLDDMGAEVGRAREAVERAARLRRETKMDRVSLEEAIRERRDAERALVRLRECSRDAVGAWLSKLPYRAVMALHDGLQAAIDNFDEDAAWGPEGRPTITAPRTGRTVEVAEVTRTVGTGEVTEVAETVFSSRRNSG